MPRTYRAKQSGAFGTNAYPDTSPEIDVAGAIGAVVQAVATTREALVMREQLRRQAQRQATLDAFQMRRAEKEDARADRQEGREDRRETRESARADREAAAAVEENRYKAAERRSKGYTPGGTRAVPRAGVGVNPSGQVPSIELIYEPASIDPTRSAEHQTKERERTRKRDAYGRSGKIPAGILDAAVEDDAIARSYLGNPKARAGANRDADQEEEEDIERAFRAVNTQVDDARGRAAAAKEKLPKRDGDAIPLQRPNRADYKDEAEYNVQARADSTYRADSARAMVPYRRETQRLDSLMTVQGALANQMQGKAPATDFSSVRGGSSSGRAPKADFSKVRGGSSAPARPAPKPKPVSSDTTKQAPTRASMLAKAKAAYQAGPQTPERKARYDRAVANINAKYPR